MKTLPMVLAHTGNDAVDHGFKVADGIVGILVLVFLILILVYLIKRRKNE